MADPVPAFPELARQEFTERKEWWKEAEPRAPLPDHLLEKLEQNDPAFEDELLRFACDFLSRYRRNPETGEEEWIDWRSWEEKDGSWLWTLYLMDHPLARKAFLRLLRYTTWTEVHNYSQYSLYDLYHVSEDRYALIGITHHFYRYLKGIYKLAEQRRDYPVWSLLAYRFEIERDKGFFTYLDSSYQYVYPIRTHYYLRRRSWRMLRKLGKAGSPDYVKAAMEVLLHYEDKDGELIDVEEPGTGKRKWILDFTHLWLFNHLLYRNSTRFYSPNSRRWKAKSDAWFSLPDRREEAFPELWDKHPEALWRLVQEAKASPVIQFAGRALRLGNPSFLQGLSKKEIEMLFTSDHPARRAFAAGVILDRLDPMKPEMDTLFSLLFNQHEEIREEANRFIERNIGRWQERQLVELASKLAVKLRTSLSSQEQEELSPEVLGNVVHLFSGPLRGMLHRFATIDLVVSLAKVEHAAVQEMAADILREIDFTRHPYRGDRLLPLLTHQSPIIKQAARHMLSEHFAALQIDAGFVVELALIPDEDHQVFVTQFLTDRLLWLKPIMPEIITGLRSCLTQTDIAENVRDYILEDLLGTLFWSELSTTPLDRVLLYLNSDQSNLQEFGARLLQLIQPDPRKLSFKQLLSLAHARVALAREEGRRMILQVREHLDADGMVNLVETEWDDTREWMFGYMRTLSPEQVTPDLIYGLLDSARSDVQQFAMEMAAIYHKEIDQQELMLRASESPWLQVQEYTLELAEGISWNGKLFKRMEPFFRRIFFRVHKGRKAKRAAFQLLLRLGEQSEELAEQVVPLLADIAQNGGKKDFEQIIHTLTRIQVKYPHIKTPLKVGQ